MQTLLFMALLMKFVVFFSLMRNPVANKPSYRFYVIHKLPQVRVLDFVRIKKKVAIFKVIVLIL